MPAPYDLDRAGLGALLADEPAYRTRQVWDGLYRRALRPEEMTDLPGALRQRLEDQLAPALSVVEVRQADDGDTTKWLFALHDGARIETVLMAYPDRLTVCVSTQAGCAMACSFCATGQAGYRRNLSAGEIVEQVITAIRAAKPRRLSRVVFMGMGEPLANYDQLLEAIGRLHQDVGLSARHLTVSTVGIVPGIRKLAAEPLPVNLAVSLHAANDTLRDELVPINRRYPLAVLSAACAEYVAATGRRLSIEWAMIQGVNDRGLDATELAAFARPLRAHVNLIPLNPTPGYPVRGTALSDVRRFANLLGDFGVNATVRVTRGAEIDAACGQLAAPATEATPGDPGSGVGTSEASAASPVGLRPRGGRSAR